MKGIYLTIAGNAGRGHRKDKAAHTGMHFQAMVQWNLILPGNEEWCCPNSKKQWYPT